MLTHRNINYSCAISVFFIYLFLCENTQAQTTIAIPFSPYHTPAHANYYYEEALKLALTKTISNYGKTEITSYPFSAGRERQRAILKKNTGIDVIWSSSSTIRETKLLAIKFNLLRNLSNKKILLIRKEDKAKFAAIKSLEDLRKFKAGSGSHWQDTNTLEHNDMPLVTSWDYEPMFKMLIAKRFDYIVRGSQEIWAEIEQHPELPLMAEDTLLISYELPVYFFVNPQNTQLAERIKTGLEIAEKDGSLDKLFFSIPSFRQGYDAVTNKNRKLIKMQSIE